MIAAPATLTAAMERHETHADPEHSLVGSARTAGRVVVSAAVVMIAVFFTFALSGPLAPEEMGVILAVTRHAAWHQPKWLAASCRRCGSPINTAGTGITAA